MADERAGAGADEVGRGSAIVDALCAWVVGDVRTLAQDLFDAGQRLLSAREVAR